MPRSKKSDSKDDAVVEVEKKEAPVTILEATKEERNIFVPKTKAELLEEKLKPFIEEEGRKMVRGRFRNFESPDGRTTVRVKKYKSVPEFCMEMIDGREYSIPLYVARFLNGIDVTAGAAGTKIGTCSYVIHGFKWDGGKPMPTSEVDDRGIPVPNTDISKKVRRLGFESLEFEQSA